MKFDCYPELNISKKALEENLRLLQGCGQNSTKVLIPVKANAYGCGILELLPFFNEVKIDYLGVANPLEGYTLRDLGWQGQVLNLGGFYKESATIFFEYSITPSITDVWQVEYLNKMAEQRNQKLSVHLKLDLGMGRIGLKKEQESKTVESLNSAPNLQVAGIFTHFPNADIPDEVSTKNIISEFKATSSFLIEKLKLNRDEVLLHTANSYATVFYPESHFDMIRPGLMFYGYFQNKKDLDEFGKKIPLRPALSLRARPVSVRQMQKGETISYGSTFTVSEEMENVGVIPLGYADGIPRALSNNFKFGKHPLLGRVTMDQILLGKVFNLQEWVELIGPNSVSLEEVAQTSRTITYEIMTGFGNRIRRRLTD
ncbi:MAG: alanine racemase [Leptospirales bacterium]